MKTYSISQPSLDGVLSEDYLYFEGSARPVQFFSLRDGGEVKEQDMVIMEKYFNDVYNLFLRKLTIFAGDSMISDEESIKLQALLQELIKVKKIIENSEL